MIHLKTFLNLLTLLLIFLQDVLKRFENKSFSEVQDILNKKLALFFFSCNIPFKCVEDKFFIDFVKTLGILNHLYRPPNRRTIADVLLGKIYDDIQIKKKNLLDSTDSALMIDGWQNKSKNTKNLVFTLRNLNVHQTFLMSADISLQSEYGIVLAGYIEKAIRLAREKYNTDVFSASTDNDSKIVCGVKLTSANGKPIVSTTCSSHSANLLMEALIDPQFSKRVKAIVTAFTNLKIENILINSPYNGTKLKNWPETRFSYYYESCKSVSANLQKLRLISDIPHVVLPEEVQADLLDALFEEKLTSVMETLGPVSRLINLCQKKESNVADATQLWLELNFSEPSHHQILINRLKKAVQPAGYCANLLHNKYKGLLMTHDQEVLALDFLFDFGGPDCFDEYERFQTRKASSVFSKWAEACKSPISYWELCRVEFPVLSKFALKLMSIPAGTALIEGFFSNWAFVHNKFRNRLAEDRSSQLADIYYSLKFLNVTDFS